MLGGGLSQTLPPQGTGTYTMPYAYLSVHTTCPQGNISKPEHRTCVVLPQSALASRLTQKCLSTHHFYLDPSSPGHFERETTPKDIPKRPLG